VGAGGAEGHSKQGREKKKERDKEIDRGGVQDSRYESVVKR
jgi:hypothetical protein